MHVSLAVIIQGTPSCRGRWENANKNNKCSWLIDWLLQPIDCNQCSNHVFTDCCCWAMVEVSQWGPIRVQSCGIRVFWAHLCNVLPLALFCHRHLQPFHNHKAKGPDSSLSSKGVPLMRPMDPAWENACKMHLAELTMFHCWSLLQPGHLELMKNRRVLQSYKVGWLDVAELL